MNSRRGSTSSPISLVKISSGGDAVVDLHPEEAPASLVMVVSRAVRVHFAQPL